MVTIFLSIKANLKHYAVKWIFRFFFQNFLKGFLKIGHL
jgi:hypothetical protein